MFKEETLAKKFITNGFWIYLFTVLAAPSGYLIRVIISNKLEVADVGIIYSILGLIILISSYNDFGLTSSLQYFLPKYWTKKKFDSYKTAIFLCLFVQISTGALIAWILFYGSEFLAVNYFHSSSAAEVLRYFCIYFIGLNIYQVMQSIFLSFQDAFTKSMIEAVRLWAAAIFTISFYLLGQSTLLNYSLAWLFGLLIALCLSIAFFVKKYSFSLKKGNIKFHKPMMKEYFSYAMWSFAGANAGMLHGRVDQQMIVLFLGVESAGYYANYLSLLQVYGIMLTPMLAFLFPVVSEIVSKGNIQKLRLIQNYFYKYFSVFGFSFGVFVFVLGPVLALVLFGDKFVTSGELLKYSSLFIFLKVLFSINSSVLGGLGKVKNLTKIISGVVVFNIISNIILIQTIGIVGAIMTTVGGWMLMFYFSFKILNENQKINFDFRYFFKNVLLVGILGALIYYLKDSIFIFENHLRYYNLSYLIGVLISYFLIISIFNYKDVKYFLDEVKKIKKDASS